MALGFLGTSLASFPQSLAFHEKREFSLWLGMGRPGGGVSFYSGLSLIIV